MKSQYQLQGSKGVGESRLSSQVLTAPPLCANPQEVMEGTSVVGLGQLR